MTLFSEKKTIEDEIANTNTNTTTGKGTIKKDSSTGSDKDKLKV